MKNPVAFVREYGVYKHNDGLYDGLEVLNSLMIVMSIEK